MVLRASRKFPTTSMTAAMLNSSYTADERDDPLGKRILHLNQTAGPLPPLWFIGLFILGGSAAALGKLGALRSGGLNYWATKFWNRPCQEKER